MLFHIGLMSHRHSSQEIWMTKNVSKIDHFCQLQSQSQRGRENTPCHFGDILSNAYAIHRRSTGVDRTKFRQTAHGRNQTHLLLSSVASGAPLTCEPERAELAGSELSEPCHQHHQINQIYGSYSCTRSSCSLKSIYFFTSVSCSRAISLLFRNSDSSLFNKPRRLQVLSCSRL
jgi:hypothetical protein